MPAMMLWRERRLLSVLVLLYFAQGLPSGLLAKAVPALAREAGMPLPHIGLLSLAALPWALKFIWAPWVDHLGLGRANHRKRWIIACQLGAAGIMVCVAMLEPARLFTTDFLLLVGLLGLLNLFCATHDIAADGLAVRMLTPTLRGPGNGIQVFGYKAGLIIGGGTLLMWIGLAGWRATFLMVALVLLMMLLAVDRYPEPAAGAVPGKRLGAGEAARALVGFWWRPGMFWWLLLLLGYKVGDSFGSRMLKPMLIDQGWSLFQVGRLDVVASLAGLVATLAGGLWLLRLHRLRGVLLFGAMQALAFSGWAALAAMPSPPAGAIWAVALFEQCADALATVVLFTLMMDYCRPGREGADYTLQAAMQVSAAGLFTLGSGFSAAGLGYAGHFLLSALLCALAIMAAPCWWRAFRRHPQTRPDTFRMHDDRPAP